MENFAVITAGICLIIMALSFIYFATEPKSEKN